NAKLLAALSQRFVVRFFSFASSSDRVASAADLKYGGTSTRLGQAHDRARVETPRAVLKGTALVVDVVLTQTGYGGQTVPLSVEDDGRIVSTQEVALPADGESATVKARFTANEAGARVFSF